MNSKEKVVLIPTDFSEICENAINHGARLSKLIDTNVCLLHVFNSDSKSYLKKEGLKYNDLSENLNKLAEKYIDEYKIKIDTKIVEGNLFESIEKVANELNSILLILGTHGKSGIQHITGSYALKVVINSPTPTIVFQQRAIEKGFKIY